MRPILQNYNVYLKTAIKYLNTSFQVTMNGSATCACKNVENKEPSTVKNAKKISV